MHASPENAHKNAQNVEKIPQEDIAIDEVKCRKKIATICLQKSTSVRYYFSSILNIYVIQIKYLEMKTRARFYREKLVYILIGGTLWLYK